LFRDYPFKTIWAGPGNVYDYVGATKKVGNKICPVGYGLQSYRAHDRPYILVYHGVSDKNGQFIQGQRLSKFQNGRFNLQEGFFKDKKTLVKGTEFSAQL
jgi:hypothetical protein